MKGEVNTCEWIAEENMKVWQIDLFHRVTEENGVYKTDRSQNSNYRFRPRINPPARHIEDQSRDDTDYTPEKETTPSKSKRTSSHDRNADAENRSRGTDDWRKTILQPRNTPPASNNPRRVQAVQRNSDGSIIRNDNSRYAPYTQRPRQNAPPRSGPAATNVRITKAILDSILRNPDYFTQINTDQPPHLCTFLKVKF